MGWIRHHAIIVTSWDQKFLMKAREHAVDIFGWSHETVSSIMRSKMNGYSSFFIPPDGSKEGWEDSNAGDERRQRFIEWLDKQRYEDGSTALDWVEVQYGDDCSHETKICRDSDEEMRDNDISG